MAYRGVRDPEKVRKAFEEESVERPQAGIQNQEKAAQKNGPRSGPNRGSLYAELEFSPDLAVPPGENVRTYRTELNRHGSGMM